MLTTIEKVIMLQEIDVFEHLTTDDLTFLASIAEEMEYSEGAVVFNEGGIPDSMFYVLEGKVRLHRGKEELMAAGKNDTFGTWALFDDEPRVATATAMEYTSVLRIDKEDFFDLLADNVRITQGVMKALVQRVRRLRGLARPSLNLIPEKE